MRKKTPYEKEKELLEIIHNAKRRLSKIQEKQKIEIGDIACKHGLHKFDLHKLDHAFSKLASELAEA